MNHKIETEPMRHWVALEECEVGTIGTLQGGPYSSETILVGHGGLCISLDIPSHTWRLERGRSTGLKVLPFVKGTIIRLTVGG